MKSIKKHLLIYEFLLKDIFKVKGLQYKNIVKVNIAHSALGVGLRLHCNYNNLTMQILFVVKLCLICVLT